MKWRQSIVALALLAGSGLLQAREAMAVFGEFYEGPKTLTVELASTAKGDQALIRISGVNHAWNGKIFMASLRRATKQGGEQLDYLIKHDGADYVLMREEGERGQRIYLPGRADSPLSFIRQASLGMQPEHLMTAFEQQREAKK